MNEELRENDEIKDPFVGFRATLKNFEWGISLSVGGYLFLIFIGLTYNFFYFLPFKINIFLFSEINDFLMSPLANPLVIVLCLLSVGFVCLLYYLNFVWEKKYPKGYQVIHKVMMMGRKIDSKKFNKMMHKPIYIGSMVTLYLFVAAEFYGIYRSEKTFKDKNLFHYKLSVDKTVIKNIDSLTYVGDNSSYYFVYDTLRREATVIPKDQVKFVRIVKNPKGRIL